LALEGGGDPLKPEKELLGRFIGHSARQ
jgi:hypothetical protein